MKLYFLRMPAVRKNLGALGLWVIRHKYPVIAIILSGVFALSLNIPKLSIATSLESSFKSHNSIIREYQHFRDIFGRDDKIVILVNSSDIFSPEFLQRLVLFHRDLENSLPMLSEVRSLVNAEYIDACGEELCVMKLMPTPPETVKEARELQAKALDYPMYRNTILSENGDAVLIEVKTQAVSALTADGKRIVNRGRGYPEHHIPPEGAPLKSISQIENIAVLGVLEAVVLEYNATNFQIALSGAPAYQKQVEPKIRDNMFNMSLMVLSLTSFFMAILFRRVSGIFLPQFVVMMALGATLGLMALFGTPFTLTTSMMPSIVLSVGLTPPIHFMVVFFKYQKRVGRLRAVIRTLEHSGLPIIMTGLTTIAGLLSFSFTEIAPVAALGIFSSIAIGCSLLFTLLFLPAFLSVVKVLPAGDRERMYEESGYNRVLIWMGRAGIRYAHDIYILSFVVLIIILPGFLDFNFSHNMLHYFDEDDRFYLDTRRIEDETSGFRALEILIDTGRDNGALETDVLRKIAELEDYALKQNSLSGRPYTGRIISLLDVVRTANRASIQGGPEYYVLPDEDGQAAGLIKAVENASSGFISRYTDSTRSMARVTAMMYWNDAARDVDFVSNLKSHASGVFGDKADVSVTGAVYIGSRVIDSMMINLALGYLSAFFIITLFMIVSVGDVRLGLIAMIPNIYPIVAGLGLMGIMDIPLNTYNLIGGSIVLGVAVDDTIHFFHNFRMRYECAADVERAVLGTLRSSGRALITTTLILVSCFWLGLLSDLKVIQDFGLVVGFSLLVAFLSDVMLAPALLDYVYRNIEPDSGSNAQAKVTRT